MTNAALLYTTMRKPLCLMLCLAAGAVFGDYQYIISIDPSLAANPSNSVCSVAMSLNAQTVGSSQLGTALETRYRTFAESSANDSVVYRRHPGVVITIR